MGIQMLYYTRVGPKPNANGRSRMKNGLVQEFIGTCRDAES